MRPEGDTTLVACQCDGRGWLIWTWPDSTAVVVQRCDGCERYSSDEAALAALLELAGGARAEL